MEDDLRRLLWFAEAQNALLRTLELDCVCQEFKCGAASDDPWIAFPEPTRVHILVDQRDPDAPHRRFRAEYHPQVVRWSSGKPPATDGSEPEQGFVVRHHIDIGDGHQTISYAMERRWRASVHHHYSDVYLTGEHLLLSRFGLRKVANQIGPVEAEPVRLARAILEPERSGGLGIVEQRTADWEMIADGGRALRLEQKFKLGGRHVYWLDPERGYALLRFAEADGDEEPETLFEVEEFSQVATDFWYPSRVSSNALCPSPRRTSPVQIKAEHPPVNLPPGVNAEKVTRWATSHTMRLPKEHSLRCKYEFSNVRVGIEVDSDAFEFRPPAA